MDSASLMRKYFLFLFLVALSAESNAAFQASAINSVVSTSTGAVASTTFIGVGAANQAVYDIRPVSVGKPSIANAMKSRPFTPWGLAITAALIAADYLLDENTGEVITETQASSVNGFCGYTGSSGVTATQCINEAVSITGVSFNRWVYSPTSTDTNKGYCIDSCGGVVVQWIPDSSLAGNPLGSTSTPTDEELYDVAASLPQLQYESLFEDPVTGLPNTQDMPEFQNAADDVTSDYEAATDSDPNTNPTVDVPNGDTGTENQTEEKPDPQENYCKKYPNLVSCMEVDDVPDPSDIQTQNIDFTYSPHNLASNSSCPSPIMTPAGELSYQPACDTASGIKPVVILVFTLIGMYIISGYRTSDT